MTNAPVRVQNPFASARRPSEVGGTIPLSQAAAPAAPEPAPAAAPTASRSLPLRPMTGWEETYIERHQRDPNTARLCNEVLARCLVPPGAEPGAARERVRGLLVAERDRALVQLRQISLGPKVSSEFTCPRCQAASQLDIDLDVLPLDFGPVEPELAVELEDGVRVEMRLPTAGDQEDLLDAGVEGGSERRTWVLSRVIRRYGEHAGVDAGFARSLPVSVRRRLESALDARLPDLDLRMNTSCYACGADVVAPFDVASFFLPS